MRKMPSDNMHFRPRFNQMVSLLTNYRWRGKFTDSLMTNYRHPFVFQELQTKNVVDIKQLPYYENINYNESNIIKKNGTRQRQFCHGH